MNIDKIFGLFNSNDELNSDFNDLNDVNNYLDESDIEIIKLHQQPLFWVGMFEKLIKNNEVFKNRASKFLLSIDSNYDMDELKKSSDILVHIKAWSYIKRIDLSDPEHQRAIISRDKHGLSYALETAIEHYISREEYEKCAFLNKIQTILKESLASQENFHNF
jgi:DNA gyrase/topoisomerase IV subunit A